MKKLILIALFAALAMPQATQADILVGFENWTVNNPNGGAGVVNAASTTETGFSGDSTTGNAGWGRSALGSHDDGTFGTEAGAETLVAFNRGLSLNNGANGFYDFSISNNSADDYELEFFHFDTGLNQGRSADNWTLSIVSGDLATQTVNNGANASITGGVVDWFNEDVSLASLTGGNVLAVGETATFRLTLSEGEAGGGRHAYLDNIAVSGVVAAPAIVPEPSSLALLGLAGFGMFVRRRRK